MSPTLSPVLGPAKSVSSGWVIRTGVFPTRVGDIHAALCPEGLCSLSFLGPLDAATAQRDFEAYWRPANIINDPASIGCLVRRALGPLNPESCWSAENDSKSSDPIPLYLRGTDFQHRVWKSLMEIPEGEVVSYTGLAEELGTPEKARAVGQAVGANPLAYLIPCHRVVRRDGGLGGYRWGLGIKRQLLELENAQVFAA